MRRFTVITLSLVLSVFLAASASAQNKERAQKNQQAGETTNATKPCGSVGGGLDWFSIEKEIVLGKNLANQVEMQAKLVNDPVITEYVNRLGQNLVRNSDAKVPFTIKVIDSDEVNAFALPGGFFFVNTGVILEADDEAELAGVMAHEIAHVADRHGTRQATRGQLANLLSIPLIFVGGGIGIIARSSASLIVPTTFMKFSRGFEEKADCLGMKYAYDTGYDPRAMISFFEKMQAKEKKRPGIITKVFQSHPQTPDRIIKSQKLLENKTFFPDKEQYVITTSEFDEVKARLEALHGLKRGEKPSDKPTLRRTTTAPDKDKPEDRGEDKRPTLKRRD
jgi:predicted Zn-dependent protease